MLGAYLAAAGGGADRPVPSLTSRISLFFSTLLSIGSAWLYLLHSQKFVDWMFPDGRSVFLLPELSWSILFLLTVAGAVAIGLATVVRFLRYRGIGSGTGHDYFLHIASQG